MMKSVFLLSDFGTADTYVAQMKAMIYSRCSSDTVLVDLTHEVPRGSILQGAFHLWTALKVMPPGSVVVAVVDPGVGTGRRGIVCLSRGVFFVGPDNGLFGLLPVSRAWLLPHPSGEISRTFHGRDVFSPSGARLSIDPGWVDFLEPVNVPEMVPSAIDPPSRRNGVVEASVAHIDIFGNVLLWMVPEDSIGFHPRFLKLPCGTIRALNQVDTYGDNMGILCLESSQGCMEIALSGGNAANLLSLRPGDRVVLMERE